MSVICNHAAECLKEYPPLFQPHRYSCMHRYEHEPTTPPGERCCTENMSECANHFINTQCIEVKPCINKP